MVDRACFVDERFTGRTLWSVLLATLRCKGFRELQVAAPGQPQLATEYLGCVHAYKSKLFLLHTSLAIFSDCLTRLTKALDTRAEIA